MESVEENQEKKPELIRLYVAPEVITNDFHEVTPAQLQDYLNGCKDKRVRKKQLYHHLAIIAKIETNTTGAELERLLQSDVRTLLIQSNLNHPHELEQIVLKINTSIDKLYMENEYRTPIGIAVEINGELLTTGRMRNNIAPFLEEGHIMVMTTNEDYKYCCFKEIIYVSNLWRYLSIMTLGDIVAFDDGQILAKVVKCGYMRPVTVQVLKPGILSSYASVLVPYYIEANELGEKDITEIEIGIKCGAHFLVIPKIKSTAYLRAVREYVGENVKLIGSVDFDYVEKKFIDVADHLLELDAIWIENMFNPALQKRLTSAITQCNTFEKTILGTVPLKTCSDFKKFENHSRIKQLDCLLIEKSQLRKKFPLIAKKLLPVVRKQIEVPSLRTLSCGDGIVNFVLRTIYTIACQGIVISNACPKAAIAFAIPPIYCPVIAVVSDDITARLFNLRRNIKSVVIEKSNSPTEFGIAFARQKGIFSTGDFIISISDSMDNDSQVCVNLRAYYLPPNVE